MYVFRYVLQNMFTSLWKWENTLYSRLANYEWNFLPQNDEEHFKADFLSQRTLFYFLKNM